MTKIVAGQGLTVASLVAMSLAAPTDGTPTELPLSSFPDLAVRMREGRLVLDQEALNAMLAQANIQTVQFFNFPNFPNFPNHFNCFRPGWRNC